MQKDDEDKKELGMVGGRVFFAGFDAGGGSDPNDGDERD